MGGNLLRFLLSQLFKFSKLKKTFIVAEIGVNHEGDFNKALDLIKKADEAGVDAVKFQTYKAEHYISSTQPERRNRAKRFQLSKEQFVMLSKEAKKRQLKFFSTPLHMDDIDFLKKISDIIKISSGDLTNLELIKYAARKYQNIIISTGLGTEKEIREAVNTVFKEKAIIRKNQGLVLMHCVSAYPTPEKELNLANIKWLQDNFNLLTGYSDHSLGTKACELSIMFGVKVIEKHFTYRKENQIFHDHAISADPQDMKELVLKVRKAELILGKYKRRRGISEKRNLKNMRRSYCAIGDLEKGHKIKKKDLILLRPALGFEPNELKKIVGKSLKRKIKSGSVIKRTDVS